MAWKCISLVFSALFLFTTYATYIPSIFQTPLTFDKVNAGRFKVPGDSPAFHCSDPSNDLFTIQRLDLFPNPPIAGKMFEARWWGNFNEDTGPDPQITLNATIDDYRSVDATGPFDDLDIWQNQHRSCPPKQGFAEIWFRAPIMHGSLHDGNYTIRSEAVTKDGRRMFCVVGSQLFHDNDYKQNV